MSFVLACTVAEVPVGSALGIDLGGDADIAVVNTGDGFFAIRDVCSHAEVPLSDGDIDGSTLECYMHGSRFDLRTGFPLELPAIMPGPVYPVRLEGDSVFVDPDNPIKTQE